MSVNIYRVTPSRFGAGKPLTQTHLSLLLTRWLWLSGLDLTARHIDWLLIGQTGKKVKGPHRSGDCDLRFGAGLVALAI